MRCLVYAGNCKKYTMFHKKEYVCKQSCVFFHCCRFDEYPANNSVHHRLVTPGSIHKYPYGCAVLTQKEKYSDLLSDVAAYFFYLLMMPPHLFLHSFCNPFFWGFGLQSNCCNLLAFTHFAFFITITICIITLVFHGILS